MHDLIKYIAVYMASDGYTFTRKYKTEAGLKKLVEEWVGNYKSGRTFFVSYDGVGTIDVEVVGD